jgi:hypothetical protein
MESNLDKKEDCIDRVLVRQEYVVWPLAPVSTLLKP